jgi:hypothetical protein
MTLVGIKDYIIHLIHDSSLNVGDVGVGGITLATLYAILPKATAVLSLVWLVLRLIVTIRDDFLNRKK